MLKDFADDHYRAWLHRIQHTHRRRIRVQTMNLEHKKVTEITPRFANGDVTIDVSRSRGDEPEPTRVLTLDLLDPSRSLAWEPDSAAILTAHLSRMVRVWHEVWVPEADDWIGCPVFTGPIADVDREGAMVHLVAEGKERLSLGHFGTRRSWGRKVRVTDVIKALLRSTGETHMQIPDLDDKLPERFTVTHMDRPWAEAQKLAKSINHILFYDGRGVATLRKQPKRTGLTVNFMLLAGDVKIDREPGEWHNRWRVLGPKPRGEKKQIVADVKLPAKHPLSAQSLGRDDEPRWLIDQRQDSKIGKQKKANEIAEDLRDAQQAAQTSTSFDTLPIPNLEEYDLVKVVDRKVGVQVHRVRQATIPLGTEGAPTQSWGSLKRTTAGRRQRGTLHATPYRRAS